MGQWADLPTELVNQVLQELCLKPNSIQNELLWKSGHKKSLLNCTYVSRQLHAVAKPLLFRDVRLQVPLAYNERGRTTSFPSLRQFTCAIALNPHLGNYVRSLSVDSLGSNYGHFESNLALWKASVDEQKVQDVLSGDKSAHTELSAILQALPELGLSNGLVLHGHSEGIFITLLHLLPKLLVLNIVARSNFAFIAYSCFGGFGGNIPGSLRSISELSLAARDELNNGGGFDIHEFAPFMCLPSLQTMTVHNSCEGEYDLTPWLQLGVSHSDVPPSSLLPNGPIPNPPTFFKIGIGYALLAKSSCVTSLHLKSSVASCISLSKILMLPMHLERFEYEIGEPSHEPFCPSDFLPGLLTQALSLRELKITLETDNHEWDDDEPFIGSLSGMITLETLQVPLPVLLAGAEEFRSDGDNEEDDGGDEGDEDDEDVDNDTKDARDKDGWPVRLLNPPVALAGTHNPLDDLLPPNLNSLELSMAQLSFAQFMKRTGLPQSLVFTRQRVPTLINLEVTGGLGNYSVTNHLLELAPELDPPINVTFFGISN